MDFNQSGLRSSVCSLIGVSLAVAAGAWVVVVTSNGASGALVAIAGGSLVIVALATVFAIHRSLSRKLERRVLSLRVSDERFRGILDNANAAIYMKDADSRYLLVNREFERIRGLGARDLIGRREDEIGLSVTARQIRASDLAVIDSATAMSFEQEMITQDGLRTFLSLKFPVATADGVVTAIAGISTDLTGQKTVLSQHESRDTHAVERSRGDDQPPG